MSILRSLIALVVALPFASAQIVTETFTADEIPEGWSARGGSWVVRNGRLQNLQSVSADLIYKMTRSLWIKGTVRRDWLDSNQPLQSSASTVVMLGVRVQN